MKDKLLFESVERELAYTKGAEPAEQHDRTYSIGKLCVRKCAEGRRKLPYQ